MMCGQLPAVLTGEFCYYGYECDEGLDCFYGEFSGLCLTKDVPLGDPCTEMGQCANGNECRDEICAAPLVAVGGDCAETSDC